MQDIGFFDTGAACPDLKLLNGDLAADEGLETAVLISLFSDRYLQASELPSGVSDGAGWWADTIDVENTDRTGSRIWYWNRIGKIDVATRNGLIAAVEEALEWMIEVGLAQRIIVSGEVITGERIDLDVQILRPEGDDIPLKFLWDGQELKARG